MGGGGGTEVVMQPGANAPAYEMSPEEKKLLSLQSQAMESYMPAIQGYVSEIMPLEQNRMKQMNTLTDPLFNNELLKGQFSVLGQDFGADTEAAMFDRNMQRNLDRMNSLGILDSGMTADLGRKTAQDISLASSTNKRNELMQLLNLAMGTPMTALPAAQTASQSASDTIQNMANARNQYTLQQYSMNAPKVASVQQTGDPMAGLMGGLGQAAGSVGGAVMTKMMFALPCFTGDMVVVTNKGLSLIKNVKADSMIRTPFGFVPVLKVHKHKYNGEDLYRINMVEVTKDHEFVMHDYTLKSAENIKLGDILCNGVVVESSRKIEKKSTKYLYNLEVVGGIYNVWNMPVSDMASIYTKLAINILAYTRG